jgi:hypothetical protein
VREHVEQTRGVVHVEQLVEHDSEHVAAPFRFDEHRVEHD